MKKYRFQAIPTQSQTTAWRFGLGALAVGILTSGTIGQERCNAIFCWRGGSGMFSLAMFLLAAIMIFTAINNEYIKPFLHRKRHGNKQLYIYFDGFVYNDGLQEYVLGWDELRDYKIDMQHALIGNGYKTRVMLKNGTTLIIPNFVFDSQTKDLFVEAMGDS